MIWHAASAASLLRTPSLNAHHRTASLPFLHRKHDVDDRPQSGRSSELNGERLCQLVLYVVYQTTFQLAGALEISQSTSAYHLGAIGFVAKLSKWATHELTERQRQRRVESTVSLQPFKSTRT